MCFIRIRLEPPNRAWLRRRIFQMSSKLILVHWYRVMQIKVTQRLKQKDNWKEWTKIRPKNLLSRQSATKFNTLFTLWSGILMMCTFNELPLPACAYFTDYGFSVPFFLRLTLIRVVVHSSSCSSQKNDHRYLSIAALHIIVAALLCVHNR